MGFDWEEILGDYGDNLADLYYDHLWDPCGPSSYYDPPCISEQKSEVGQEVCEMTEEDTVLPF